MVRYIAESEEDFQTIQEPRPAGYLTLMVEGRISHSFPLRGEVSMGREKGNSVVVADQKVSRHHASMMPIDNTFIISDMGSANGTYVNGVLIAQPTRLKDKDRISLGDTTFLFTMQQPDSHADALPASPSSAPIPAYVQPPNVAPTTNHNNTPIWALVGCLALVIVALLFMLAVLVGLFIGRTDIIGLIS